MDFSLVTPAEVAKRLSAGNSARRPVLLEAHFTAPDHPARIDARAPVHIPGAIEVHPSYLEAGCDRAKYYPFYDHPAEANLLPDDQLHRALLRLGITPQDEVIVYGREPDGAMAAARLCWGLLYAGVARVRLLDGGLAAWLHDGGATQARIENAADLGRNDDRVDRQAISWSVRRDLLATTAEVRASATDGASKLIDVRRYGEWDGSDTDHYCFFSKAGHIPSAVHQGDWDNLLHAPTAMLGPHLEAVARRWRAGGILDAGVAAGQTTLIFYCGTGWRSSVAFLVAHLLGLRAKSYDDGFFGWSRDPANEISLGAAACA